MKNLSMATTTTKKTNPKKTKPTGSKSSDVKYLLSFYSTFRKILDLMVLKTIRTPSYKMSWQAMTPL